LWCDSIRWPAPSASNTSFGLKAGGGGLYFYNKQVNGGDRFDVYGIQAADFSIGIAWRQRRLGVDHANTRASNSVAPWKRRPAQDSTSGWRSS